MNNFKRVNSRRRKQLRIRRAIVEWSHIIGGTLIFITLLMLFGVAGATDCNPDYNYVAGMVRVALMGIVSGAIYFVPEMIFER